MQALFRGLGNPRGKPASKEELAQDTNEKFKVIESALSQEKTIDQLAMMPTERRETLKKVLNSRLEELKAKYDSASGYEKKTLGAKIDAIVMWQTQIETESLSEGADANILKDFYAWLLGKGKEEDHRRTPWYRERPMLELEDVREWLGGFTDVMWDTRAELEKLIFRTPRTLEEAWIYYKFVVHMDWMKTDDKFLFVDIPRMLDGGALGGGLTEKEISDLSPSMQVKNEEGRMQRRLLTQADVWSKKDNQISIFSGTNAAEVPKAPDNIERSLQKLNAMFKAKEIKEEMQRSVEVDRLTATQRKQLSSAVQRIEELQQLRGEFGEGEAKSLQGFLDQYLFTEEKIGDVAIPSDFKNKLSEANIDLPTVNKLLEKASDEGISSAVESADKETLKSINRLQDLLLLELRNVPNLVGMESLATEQEIQNYIALAEQLLPFVIEQATADVPQELRQFITLFDSIGNPRFIDTIKTSANTAFDLYVKDYNKNHPGEALQNVKEKKRLNLLASVFSTHNVLLQRSNLSINVAQDGVSMINANFKKTLYHMFNGKELKELQSALGTSIEDALTKENVRAEVVNKLYETLFDDDGEMFYKLSTGLQSFHLLDIARERANLEGGLDVEEFYERWEKLMPAEGVFLNAEKLTPQTRAALDGVLSQLPSDMFSSEGENRNPDEVGRSITEWLQSSFAAAREHLTFDNGVTVLTGFGGAVISSIKWSALANPYLMAWLIPLLFPGMMPFASARGGSMARASMLAAVAYLQQNWQHYEFTRKFVGNVLGAGYAVAGNAQRTKQKIDTIFQDAIRNQTLRTPELGAAIGDPETSWFYDNTEFMDPDIQEAYTTQRWEALQEGGFQSMQDLERGGKLAIGMDDPYPEMGKNVFQYMAEYSNWIYNGAYAAMLVDWKGVKSNFGPQNKIRQSLQEIHARHPTLDNGQLMNLMTLPELYAPPKRRSPAGQPSFGKPAAPLKRKKQPPKAKIPAKVPAKVPAKAQPSPDKEKKKQKELVKELL